MINRRRGGLVVPLCFLFAFLLTVMPLPDLLGWFRPLWPLLVVVYWAVALPERYSVWTGFLAGLFMDVLRGTPLGAHALAFAVAGFAAARLSARLKVYPMPQQAVVVGLLAGVAILILRTVANANGGASAPLLAALVPAIVTAALWPPALGLQDRLRRIFGVN